MKHISKKKFRLELYISVFLFIIVFFVSGFLFALDGSDKSDRSDRSDRSDGEMGRAAPSNGYPAAESKKPEFWTCAMHPQIRKPAPGRCPICAMELIPVYKESSKSENQSITSITLTPQARKLAEIEVSPVIRKNVSKNIRMVGKVAIDETKIANISAWVSGRIDKLYINFTGTTVKKGEPLVSLYSPDLIVAQQELIQSLQTVKSLEKSGLENTKDVVSQTPETVREKLRLLGLSEAQIKKIEESQKPSEHIQIYSPIGGVVIKKDALQGMYVDTGTQIYTVADLSEVWVLLDAYESDLQWIKKGEEVKIETKAYPGETFNGKVTFIDPVLNDMTRTVKVRVNVPNPDGKLKPDMFIDAQIFSEIKEESQKSKEAPLVIPASAPLITGKRAIVYVAIPDKEGEYEEREITLGTRAGDEYVVEKGLNEGEMVVTKGNFKIDSALQLLAKPSMMNPEGGGPAPVHEHGGMAMPMGASMNMPIASPMTSNIASPMSMPMPSTQPREEGKEMENMKGMEKPTSKKEIPKQFKEQIDAIFSAYLEIHKNLADDNLKEAQVNAKKLTTAVDAVNMDYLTDNSIMSKWMEEEVILKTNANDSIKAKKINEARQSFSLLSDSMTKVVKDFGTSNYKKIFLIHCPMAFNGKGADWLQITEKVQNPYFGKGMPECGEQKETIEIKK